MPRIVRGQSSGVEGTVENMKHLSRHDVREIDRRAIEETFAAPEPERTTWSVPLGESPSR